MIYPLIQKIQHKEEKTHLYFIFIQIMTTTTKMLFVVKIYTHLSVINEINPGKRFEQE